MTAPPALQARALRAGLGGVEVLHGLDLQLAAGRWTSVVGPNGAGKSTLLRALAGLLPHQGEVRLKGRLLRDIPPRERARMLSWLGQSEGAATGLTAWEVAMLGRLPHRGWLAPPAAADRSAVEQALRSTHAWETRARPLAELSGGERQRVLLARALAVQADLLLMDEPLAHLDPPHQADWLALVGALAAQGSTVVSVLHELSLALHAHDLVIMAGGEVVHHGACQDPRTHAALEAVFQGRIAVHRLGERLVVLPRLAD